MGKYLRWALFALFFLLSIRFFLSYAIATPSWATAGEICGIGFIFALCWWRLLFCLFFFIALIPVASGIQNMGIMGGIPLYSFSFACIYIAWFLKRVVYQKKSIQTENRIENLIDLFSGIIIFSLIMQLSQYPLDFVLYRFKYASVLRQSDPFWCLEASYILLQGLFLYRLLSMEGRDADWPKWVDRIFRVQTIAIIGFTGVQFFLLLNRNQGVLAGVFWPFDDIHSYGSYVVFLFFYHVSQVIYNQRYRGFSLAASMLLFGFILASYSRSAWVALTIVSLTITFLIISRPKRKWFVISVTLFFLGVSFLLGPVLLSSDKKYLHRLGRLVSITNYDKDKTIMGRMNRWRIAVQIARDFPITGSGIGSYLRLAPSYAALDKDHKLLKKIKKRFNVRNNVHNYYLQLLAEIGSIGLFVFLWILVCIYQTGFRCLKKTDRKKAQIHGLLFGLSAYLITMITSHPTIISKQQLMFWFVLSAIGIGFSQGKKRRTKSRLETILISFPFVFFIVLIPGYFLNAKTFGEIEGMNFEYGYYEKEKIDETYARWTMRMSGSKEFAQTDIIGIRVYMMPEKVSVENVYLDLFINHTQIDRILFEKTGFKHLYYYIPGIENHAYVLRTKANTSFNPYKSGLTGNLKHSRDQSAALTAIEYLTEWPEKKYKKIDLKEYQSD